MDSSSQEQDELSPESRKHPPMAFTINFSDEKQCSVPKNFRENLGKYATRHVRNSSLPNAENTKKNTKLAAVHEIGLSPFLARKPPIGTRRAGYHSEGYFSSDQEEDIRSRSDFFVKKFKNIEKGARTTNLAQEKKIMADQNIQHKSKIGTRNKLCELDVDDDGVDMKQHNNSLTNLHESEDWMLEDNLEKCGNLDSSYTGRRWLNGVNGHCPSKLVSQLGNNEEWLVASTCEGSVEVRIETQDPDELNDSSNDTVSEAGTYTIDREISCPEEEEDRQMIEEAVSMVAHHEEEEEDEENYIEGEDLQTKFKMSRYQGGTSWIKEWATQVVKHNNETGPDRQNSASLPPLPVGKQQGYSPISKLDSPLHKRLLESSGRKAMPSPQSTPIRKVLSPMKLDNLRNQDIGATEFEYQGDNGLETECFLRATESVVSAMQARMTLSQDSGGESDVDTSHSYGRKAGQSDSSSETGGEGKAKRKEQQPQVQTRYNRAFSLRRGRLDCDNDPKDKKKKGAGNSDMARNNKKISDPPKQIQTKINKPKPTKTDNAPFSRTDSGRFSIKASKNNSQVQSTSKNPAVKKDSKKSNQGARSNSTLSSREVEFQNWKRRKSYDPMKAAAEGKKKEAAKKNAVMSSSMTQSSISNQESSPSHQNPVLRSASFHGTGGSTPHYISSEEEEEEEEEDEEVTLSADEDSPVAGAPLPFSATPSPTKVVLGGLLGSSRASVYSTPSNSSLRSRTKLEALDNLVMTAVCGLSHKLRGSSCRLLRKLRYLYKEESDQAEKLTEIIEVLENTPPSGSPQTKSPSKELSGTLKNLKNVEDVFKVLDEVLFEDFELEPEEY